MYKVNNRTHSSPKRDRRAAIKAVFLFFLICFAVFQYNAVTHGASSVQFELFDGSIIKGYITSYKNGVYIVHTLSLGNMSIPENKIRVIRNISRSEYPKTPEIKKQVDTVSKLLLNSPAYAESITALQQDPDFQSILNDASIMKAVRSLDIESLISNPKFMRLLEKEDVKKIIMDIK